MADEIPLEDSELNLTLVTAGKPPKGMSSRRPVGMTVTKTGRCVTNVAGAEVFRTVANKLGFDPDSWYLQYRVDAEKGLVRASFVSASAPGAIPVLRPRNSNALVIYVGSIFVEYPLLRLKTDQFVTVTPSLDGKAVVFNIKSTLDRAPAKTAATAAAPAPTVAAK